MDFSIRKVREEDAEAIIELLNPIILAGKYTAMDEPFSVDDQLDFIRGFPERGIYHAAVSNDDQKILGVQDVMPISAGSNVFKHVGEISTFVSLTAHGNGIGRSLGEATFKAAKELAFLKISATVRADNPQAVSFYLSQGFKIIGTAQKHAFLQGKYIDEILMEKLIAESD